MLESWQSPAILRPRHDARFTRMQKPLIFISHITEEREIAFALKQLIEASFLGMMEVFVSSDPTSIELGRR
jgi:hypothetical protein